MCVCNFCPQMCRCSKQRTTFPSQILHAEALETQVLNVGNDVASSCGRATDECVYSIQIPVIFSLSRIKSVEHGGSYHCKNPSEDKGDAGGAVLLH